MKRARRSRWSRSRLQRRRTPRPAIATLVVEAFATRQKLARNSARIAHGLPSHELGLRAPGTKSLQMLTIFRVVQRARQDSNL